MDERIDCLSINRKTQDEKEKARREGSGGLPGGPEIKKQRQKMTFAEGAAKALLLPATLSNVIVSYYYVKIVSRFRQNALVSSFRVYKHFSRLPESFGGFFPDAEAAG